VAAGAWLVLTYALRARRSSLRVAVWRRLRRIGAISPRGGVYVLPARDECLEAFQWLAQEIEHAKGEALVMHVARFDGVDDAELAALFRAARKRDYDAVDASAAKLERGARGKPSKGRRPGAAREQVARLRRAHAEIARIDFFDAPERDRVAARLARIEEALAGSGLADQPAGTAGLIGTVTAAEFRGRRWATRPNIHVDRLACVWLIRRFIDAAAPIRYTEAPASDEVTFDMREGTFKHEGGLCTFEVMVRAFGLTDPRLRAIGEIVHEIDLGDGRFARPEAPGIEAVLRGWAGLSDAEREIRGLELFDSLYTATPSAPAAATRRTESARSESARSESARTEPAMRRPEA
jgi:hypothetical protein